MLGDERMSGEQLMHRAAERARALAVNDADGGEAGEERVVQVLLERLACLVGGAPDEMKLGADGTPLGRDASAPRPAVSLRGREARCGGAACARDRGARSR